MTAIFDGDSDIADRFSALDSAGAQGAWFSLAGTEDPAALDPEAFAQDGIASGMGPCALLTALAEGAFDPAVLGRVSDNALLGVVGASQRLMSRAAAMTQRAVAEYARRSRTTDWKRLSPAGFVEFSPDDLAPELVMNANQAEAAMLRHERSERRLPACSQALWDGKIGEYPMKIIADATICLDDKGAAEADQILAQAAPGLTSGKLRALAARVVLMIDPDAAEERRREAAGRARVVKYREDAGTGALCGRDLPSDAVLRSWQHIDAAARAFRASGIKAGLDKLRAAVYLGLTSGTDPLALLPLLEEGAGESSSPDASAGGGGACDARESDNGRDRDDRDRDDSGDDGSDGDQDDQDGEGGARRDGPGCPSPRGPEGGGAVNPVAVQGAPFQAVINLLVPVGTGFGWSFAPGEISGWGPLDPETTRDMMAAASRHPLTRWCVTTINEDGTAAAHGCAAGRHPWSPPDPAKAGLRQQAAKFLASLRADLSSVAKGTCDHAEYTDRYEVPRKLKHIIRARTATCVAPCCNRPAADGDADHTIPWPDGPTCQENLGPPCRHHHRNKQAPGWTLEQPEPGVFRWTSPSGRVRTTYPTRYLI